MNRQREFGLTLLTLISARFLWTAFLVLLLAGCGATLTDVRGKFADSRPCCKSYREISYSQLDVESTRVVSIGPNDQVFQFETGKSPLLAFELPLVKEPLRLTVESYMQSSLQSPMTDNQYFFAPNLVLLDAEYRVLRVQEPRNRHVRYVPVTEFFGTGGLGWKIVWGTDIEADEGVRFAIIRTTERLLAEDTKMPLVRTGATGPVAYPNAPTGRMRIGLKRVLPLLESIMVERKPAYIVIAGIPPGKTGGITSTLKAEQRTQMSFQQWPAFRSGARGLIDTVVLRNDYPEVALHTGLLELLEAYPGAPFGITWNGGIAITALDYSWAEQQLDLFRSDPARYERERPKEPNKDRLHPLNHLGPLLDW